MEQRHKLLGTLLVDMDVITGQQLEEGLNLHRQSDKKVGEALQELGFCTSEDVCQALAMQSGLRYLDPTTVEIPREVIQLVPEAIVREHHVMPVSREDGRITIATSDPFDLFAQDNVRFATNTEVDCVLASRESIQQAIERYYGVDSEKIEEFLEDAGGDVEFREEKELEEAAAAEGDDAPVIKLVTLIISEAIRRRASDIHIEPLENRLRIRYRVDGVCFEVDSPPKRLQASIISRIKIMAKIDIAEKRRPTDGRIKLKLVGRDVDLRVSCLPASHGESVVMRILDKSSVLYGIQELGFMDDDYKRFRNIIRRPNGVFLVTGPTGSGKTTTLYAALQELNTPDRKIITAEDPVEYNIAGLNQSEVRRGIGLTFVRILRAMLRQAPNVILHTCRRNPRPGDRRNRHPSRPYRALSVQHAPHQRRAVRHHTSDRHGRCPLPCFFLGAGVRANTNLTSLPGSDCAKKRCKERPSMRVQDARNAAERATRDGSASSR